MEAPSESQRLRVPSIGDGSVAAGQRSLSRAPRSKEQDDESSRLLVRRHRSRRSEASRSPDRCVRHVLWRGHLLPWREGDRATPVLAGGADRGGSRFDRGSARGSPRGGGGRVAGPGFSVFAINPKQADRARELFVLSGATDDPRDAEGLSVVLRTVPRVFPHLQPKHPVLVRLRDRSRLRADLVKRRTQLSQKIRSQLLRYFPGMWELAGGLSGLWGALFLTLWERAPTPERARRLRRATLLKVLRECRIRKRTVEEVYALFHQPALVVAPGVTQGAMETIQMLVAQLQLVNDQVKTMDRGITALLEELPAALGEVGDEADEADSLTRLLSMKGAGTVVGAGLFGEASDLLVGGSFQQTRAYLGAAPVTKKSGQTERIYKRRAVKRGLGLIANP